MLVGPRKVSLMLITLFLKITERCLQWTGTCLVFLPSRTASLPTTWRKQICNKREDSDSTGANSSARVLKTDYILSNQLLIFHPIIWVYFLPPNPSNKFLFTSLLVASGCLSLTTKVRLPNHVLRGPNSSYWDGKAITAWWAGSHFKIDACRLSSS